MRPSGELVDGELRSSMAPDECKEDIMWSWADRMVKAVSDVTVGTVIVLVHVALADRDRRKPQSALPSGRRNVN